MSITKESLLTLKKDVLVATALEHKADITQAKTKGEIADKILEKLSILQPQEAPKAAPKKEKKPLVIDKEEVAAFFNGLIEKGALVEKEDDVITVKYHGKETCLNINQPLNAIKRAITMFMVDLPKPIEATLQR